MRELVWMAESRSRDAWQIAAAQMALLANINRDPKKGKPARPDDFNPYARPKETKLTHAENMARFKAYFTQGK